MCVRKNLMNVGFNLFDPTDGLQIPKQLEDKINLENKSYLTTAIGLAFRKLDVFGYYKFVTAVKNINLLPNRQSMFKQKKMKAISGFAFKGIAASIAALYIILFSLSFWNIFSYNKQLADYDNVKKIHKETNIPLIGIGAGDAVDGQVLVIHDLLGLTNEFNPRFLRRYLDLNSTIKKAVKKYVSDVKSKKFPNKKEMY